MLIWLIIATLFGTAVVCTYGIQKRNNRIEKLMCTSWVIFIILLLFALPWYISTFYEYTNTKAFIESNEIVLRAASVQGQIDAAVIGDLSNSTVGPELIQRLDLFVFKVNQINKYITTAKSANETILFDGLYFDWPEYPDLLPADKIAASIEHFKKQVNNIEGVVIFKAP